MPKGLELLGCHSILSTLLKPLNDIKLIQNDEVSQSSESFSLSLLRVQLLKRWLSQEYYILFIDHLNDLDALSSVDLTLLSFRSNVYYVDENRVLSYYVLST